jgi:hypothetical protein
MHVAPEYPGFAAVKRHVACARREVVDRLCQVEKIWKWFRLLDADHDGLHGCGSFITTTLRGEIVVRSTGRQKSHLFTDRLYPVCTY